MKILLLGGTGAMGTHLVSILSACKENEIFVTSRSPKDNHGNVKFIRGNAHDKTFIVTLLAQKWDVIVDFMVYTTPEFKDKVDKILDATRQYIFLSSSRVYADSPRPMTEDSPRLLDTTEDKEYLATDEYALTKARQENILFRDERKNWTVIRPYITYAENRLQLGVLELQDWLPRALQGRSIVFSKDIAGKKTTMTYGYNVAEGIASIIGRQNAYGKAFHITQSRSLLWSDILSIYLDAIEEDMGFRPKVKMIDECPNLKVETAKYQVKYDRLFNRIFSSLSISEFCEVDKFVSPEIGLRKCIKEYIKANKANIKNIPLNEYSNAQYDRIADERTPMSLLPDTKTRIKYLMSRYAPKLASSLISLKNTITSR